MQTFPVLETERLVLREFRDADARAVLEIYRQPLVTRYHTIETMHTLEPARKLIRTRQRLFAREEGIRWAIALRKRAGVVIGSCGCYNLHKPLRSMEIGYELHPDHWRQGIMSEALAAMLDFCYSAGFFYPLNRTQALTNLGNEASQGLLEKLGFREEGILRAYGYWKGQFHDVRSFSLLRVDWEA